MPFSTRMKSTRTTAKAIKIMPGSGERSGVALPRRCEKFTAILIYFPASLQTAITPSANWGDTRTQMSLIKFKYHGLNCL